MSEYEDGPRYLPWPLRQPLIGSRTVEDDGDFPPSSFVWPDDPDERTMIPFWLSLNEYNVLGSTIDVGSDPAFGVDALRVVWLWMRNFRIEVPMPCCDEVAELDALYTTNQVTMRAIQSQALRDGLEAIYDGTPTSINPQAPTTTWSYSGSDDGKAALCAALMAFVYQAARAQAESVRAGQIIGLASIGLIAGLLIPGLNIFFLAGAAIAVLLGLGTVGVTTEVAIAALTDTSALDEVVCYMRDQLDGAAVSASTWGGSLDSYPFAGGSHAAIVADFLKASLASNYLPFLNIIGTGYQGVTDDDTLPECPCDAPLCRHIDAAHDLEMLCTPNGGLGPQAAWTGTGWGPNNALIEARITLQIDMQAIYNLKTLRVVFSGTNAVGDYNEVTVFTEGFGSVLSTEDFTADVLLAPNAMMQRFELDVVSSFAPSATPITVEITDMYFVFQGTAPTWGEPC